MVVLVLWLFLGRVDIVAAADGALEPATRVQLVQPASSGVVRRLLVREGQHVDKGQLLVELDPTISGAELGQGRDALLAAEMSVARARAVLGALDGRGFTFVPPEGASAQMVADHRALARAQLAQIGAQSGEQAAMRRASALAASEARIQAQKIGESLPLLDQLRGTHEPVALLRTVPQRRLRKIDVRFAGITHLGHIIHCRGKVVALGEIGGEPCARVEVASTNQYGQTKIAGEAWIALA